MARDEFSIKTKSLLALRVNYICSNPNCKRFTTAPTINKDKAVNIGIAAHIEGASPKGPRYNGNMTVSERKSIDNGIWLCSTCAKEIDDDELKYPVILLKGWKIAAEKFASENLGKKLTIFDKDKAIIKALISDIKKQQIVIDSYKKYYFSNKKRMDELAKYTPAKLAIIDMKHNIKANLTFYNTNLINIQYINMEEIIKDIEEYYNILYSIGESNYTQTIVINNNYELGIKIIQLLTEVV